MVVELDIYEDSIYVKVGPEDGFRQHKLAYFTCQSFYRAGVDEEAYSIGHGCWLVPSVKPDIYRDEKMDEVSRKILIPYVINASKELGVDVERSR